MTQRFKTLDTLVATDEESLGVHQDGWNRMNKIIYLEPQSKNLPPTQGMFISHSTRSRNLEVSEGRRFTGHHGRADATAALHLAPWNWGTGWISEGLSSGNLLQFAIDLLNMAIEIMDFPKKKCDFP